MTEPTGKDPPVAETARLLRARWILSVYALSVVTGVFVTSLIWRGEWWTGGSLGGFFYVFLSQLLAGALLVPLAASRGIAFGALFGTPPAARDARILLLLAIPLAGFSIAAAWAVYLPLSRLFPGFVETLLSQQWDWSAPGGGGWRTWFALMVVCVIAPVFEEFTFRGLLLTRWSQKWGTKRALIATSILFGLLHASVFGATAMGLVLGVLYFRTGSLFAPILVHAGHNTVLMLLDLLTPHSGPDPYTLADFQAEWWVGVIGGVVALFGLPLLRKARLREIDWTPPHGI